MKTELRRRAETLRRNGKGVKEISRLLGVSPGTASRWCKDVALSDSQRKTLDEKRRRAGLTALAPWINRNRRAKIVDIQTQKRNGKQDIGIMTKRDLFMLGLGLYWGEGYKRGSQECGFTNSDPLVIRTILAWFIRCYGITNDRWQMRLTLNKQYADQEKRLIREWSKETSIPAKNFSSTSVISGYGKLGRDPRTYRGTLRVKISRGTSLRRRILASIASVKF